MSEEKETKIANIGEERLGGLDLLIGKIISRKLFIWVISTVLLLCKVITADTWLVVSGIYIGANTVLQIVDILKSRSLMASSSTAKSTPPGEGEA